MVITYKRWALEGWRLLPNSGLALCFLIHQLYHAILQVPSTLDGVQFDGNILNPELKQNSFSLKSLSIIISGTAMTCGFAAVIRLTMWSTGRVWKTWSTGGADTLSNESFWWAWERQESIRNVDRAREPAQRVKVLHMVLCSLLHLWPNAA